MPTFPPWPRPATVGAAFLGLLVFVARRPDALLQPTVWAEDGRVFWAAALHPSSDLASEYAAQWWTMQRLVVLAVVQAPTPWAPVLIYLSSALIAVLAAATVLQQRSRVLFGRFRYQVLAFALVILVPTAWEVQGNLTNIQVWLGVAMMVLLVLPGPTSVLGRVAEMGFLLTAGLTGFLGVLLSPVALWALVRHRGRYELARSVVVLASATCNVLVWWTAGRSPQQGALSRMLQLPETLVFRWGGGAVLGEFPLRVNPGGEGHALALLLGAMFLAVIAAAAWRDRHGPSPVWLVPASLWTLLAIVSPTGAVGERWMFDPSAHWRYFALGVATCLLVLVRAVGTSTVRWPFWLALAACAPAFLLGARLPAMGPAVPPDELRAFASCLELPGAVCAVDIAPEGWTVVVLVPERH